MASPEPNSSPLVRFLTRRWLTIVLVILAIVFITQNRERVTISLFWMHLNSPLWVTLAVLFLVGLIAGGATFKRRAKARAKAQTNAGT